MGGECRQETQFRTGSGTTVLVSSARTRDPTASVAPATAMVVKPPPQLCTARNFIRCVVVQGGVGPPSSRASLVWPARLSPRSSSDALILYGGVSFCLDHGLSPGVHPLPYQAKRSVCAMPSATSTASLPSRMAFNRPRLLSSFTAMHSSRTKDHAPAVAVVEAAAARCWGGPSRVHAPDAAPRNESSAAVPVAEVQEAAAAVRTLEARSSAAAAAGFGCFRRCCMPVPTMSASTRETRAPSTPPHRKCWHWPKETSAPSSCQTDLGCTAAVAHKYGREMTREAALLDCLRSLHS